MNNCLKNISPAIWSAYGITQDICKWAHHILPNTNDEAMLIKKGLSIPEKKITVIPNGVEKRFAEAGSSLFYKKYGVKDFILNVGHIGVPRKNTFSLIQALSKIDHPSVIIGRIFPSEEADLCMEEGKKNKNLTNLIKAYNKVQDNISLKLYIVKFRNVGVFHEHVTNQILDDVKKAVHPRKIEVFGLFNARGGIQTSVESYWEE